MKTPICFLCNKDFSSEYFHYGKGGDTVKFSDYIPLRPGAAGHPRGLEWFCDEHIRCAQELSAFPTNEVLTQLTQKYGTFPPYEFKLRKDPELWVTSVGPNSAKIFAIFRAAALLSPAQAKEQMSAGQFKIAQGTESKSTAQLLAQPTKKQVV